MGWASIGVTHPLMLAAFQVCCGVFLWAACRSLADVEPTHPVGRRLWRALLLTFNGVGMISLSIGIVGLYFLL
jgi:hypothetical protein